MNFHLQTCSHLLKLHHSINDVLYEVSKLVMLQEIVEMGLM
jgi:hypothetical protein